jgi:hypothetical protein
VFAGTVTTLDQSVEIAFPPVAKVDFGPFHVAAGETFARGCEISAA